MFRLKASHFQALTTFSLPDALPTLGSHSVYNCGIHLVKTISKKVLFIKCVIYKLCLNIKILQILIQSVNNTLYKQNLFRNSFN